MKKRITGLMVCMALWGAGCTSGEAPSDDDGATSSGSGGGSTAASTAATGGGEPGLQPMIPAVSGVCPTFAEGAATFAPTGINPREVQVWIGPEAASKSGPLVFFWHGSGGNPLEANYAIGSQTIAAIKAEGGVVVAAKADPSAGLFPWFLTTGVGAEDDLILADEITACAIEQVGVDPRRIHATGFSAGALNASQMAYRRSDYMASVMPFSGGKLGSPPFQNESNRFAALIVHGGASDQQIINFEETSVNMFNDLRGRGHFAALCNHGGGHSYPSGLSSVMFDFFLAHPFGADSPYAAGLPQGTPTYCGF